MNIVIPAEEFTSGSVFGGSQLKEGGRERGKREERVFRAFGIMS